MTYSTQTKKKLNKPQKQRQKMIIKKLKSNKLRGGSDKDEGNKASVLQKPSLQPDSEKPLDFIRSKLTNEEHREPRLKTVKYKKLLATEYSYFPANNEEMARVSESIKANNRTLTVPKIFDKLIGSSFFNNHYLPVLETMAKVDKETGARILTFKTENKAHPEFAEYQLKKEDQFFTQDAQIAMKKETFYEYSVDELWAWWDDKFKYFMDMKKKDKRTKMINFPLNYTGYGPNILDIIRISFVNAISKIINSYIKYGQTNQTVQSEITMLSGFFNLLDKLYDTKQPVKTYKDLIEILEIYLRFWQKRLKKIIISGGYSDESRMNAVRILINKIINNNYFIIPFATSINYYKTIKAYCIPVVYFNITNATGHYKYLTPEANFVHDLHAHNQWPIKNNLLDGHIIKFTQNKVFFDKYEKLQKEIDDKDLLEYLNYFVFSKTHEDDIYFWEICTKFLSEEKCEKMKEDNLFNTFPLYKLVIFVKMLSLNANVDSLKQIFFEKSSLPLGANKIHIIDYVKTDSDGTTKIIGTQEHPEYIPLNIFADIIRILDSLFNQFELYNDENTIEPIPHIP